MNMNYLRFTQKIKRSKFGQNVKIGCLARVVYSEIGNFVKIGNFSRVSDSNIGNHSIAGDYTTIEYAKIKKFTSIGSGVSIGVANHDYNRVTSHEFLFSGFHKLANNSSYYPVFADECNIGNDVWIGANSTILRKVNIGDGAIIGANAVITKDISPYSVVVGVPGKTIKYRFENSIIKQLLELSWWNFPDILIKENIELFAAEPNEDVLNALFEMKNHISHSIK